MQTTLDQPSRSICSNQTGPHERLIEIVSKHISSPYKKPYRQHNLDAFKQLQARVAAHHNNKLILDSCCGTGMSTRVLANRNPEHLVIGVDQSAHRLNKQGAPTPENCIFLQANCEDLWRLCVSENMHFEEHYILYPNPYPKAVHFKRRWHGHPVFPSLKTLSEKLVVRSNWDLYVKEFSLAWKHLTGTQADIAPFVTHKPMTLFEKKYGLSGQALYELVTGYSDTKIGLGQQS